MDDVMALSRCACGRLIVGDAVCGCGQSERQTIRNAARKPHPVVGVGSILRRMLGCGCGSIPFAKWDASGADWCRDHREEIARVIASAPKARTGYRAALVFVDDAIGEAAQFEFPRRRVGFLAVAYLPIGGTETWHQTLLPRLSDLAGFVSTSPDLSGGDYAKLGCQTGVGLDAARQLAAAVDVLVVWGVGADLEKILPPDRPRVISVAHCDHRSQWTHDFMRAQGPWTDHAVYLCQTGDQTVPDGIPATWIRNAPDPQRVVPTRSREANREALGIGADERLIVITARTSPEKRIDRIVAAVNSLGAPYRLIVAGDSVGWNSDHRDALIAQAGPQVQIINAVDHPGDLLSAADLVVSASEYEGYGLATAEAMAAGVPTISTPVGFLEEAPELSRLVSLDADAAEWAAAITADFDEAESTAERAARAKYFMTRTHSVDRFVAEWSALIDTLSPAARAAA